MRVPSVMSAREQRRMDKDLAASLTRACETAKTEVEGFAWVTHEVEWRDFPASLQVVWIFETNAEIAQALEKGYGTRLYSLSAQALSEAGVEVDKIAGHVSFDSEEECRRVNQGNWRSRLDRLRSMNS